jgi:benzoyl-CoA reductase/2-hydroxyglutaryl-CoA dehydratase subunit BcrC/BadD/HgdB
VIFGSDAILISNIYFFDNIANWTENLSKLNNELELKLSKKEYVVNENYPRLVLTGSPSIFPNLKVPLLIEKLGGIIIADDFCSSNRLLYDTIAVDEWFLYDMIPAIADRYLKPSTCPNLTPNNDRQRKLLNTVREYSAQGVVYQSLTGCHLFEIETIKTIRMLEKEGIPVLTLETDYNPDDRGQLATRIEAFLESIRMAN